MKLRDEFISHNEDDDVFIIPSGKASFSGVVRGNKTLGVIVDLLQNDLTEAEIVEAMRKKYDAPEEIIKHDVQKVIDNLREIGAIVE